jgi:hypothetical protein
VCIPNIVVTLQLAKPKGRRATRLATEYQVGQRSLSTRGTWSPLTSIRSLNCRGTLCRVSMSRLKLKKAHRNPNCTNHCSMSVQGISFDESAFTSNAQKSMARVIKTVDSAK